MAKVKGPQVITANRLQDGVIVYLGHDEWVESLSGAAIAETEAQVEALQLRAEADVTARRVIAVYPFPVKIENGVPHPVSEREIIRASGGPTVKTFAKEE